MQTYVWTAGRYKGRAVKGDHDLDRLLAEGRVKLRRVVARKRKKPGSKAGRKPQRSKKQKLRVGSKVWVKVPDPVFGFAVTGATVIRHSPKRGWLARVPFLGGKVVAVEVD